MSGAFITAGIHLYGVLEKQVCKSRKSKGVIGWVQRNGVSTVGRVVLGGGLVYSLIVMENLYSQKFTEIYNK